MKRQVQYLSIFLNIHILFFFFFFLSRSCNCVHHQDPIFRRDNYHFEKYWKTPVTPASEKVFNSFTRKWERERNLEEVSKTAFSSHISAPVYRETRVKNDIKFKSSLNKKSLSGGTQSHYSLGWKTPKRKYFGIWLPVENLIINFNVSCQIKMRNTPGMVADVVLSDDQFREKTR